MIGADPGAVFTIYFETWRFLIFVSCLTLYVCTGGRPCDVTWGGGSEGRLFSVT